MSFLDPLGEMSPVFYKFSITIISIVAIFIVYKFLSRFISRTGREVELEPHAMNAVRLVFRVVAIMVASTILLSV